MAATLAPTIDMADLAMEEDIENDFAGGAFGDDPEDARHFAERRPLTREEITEVLQPAADGENIEVVWRFSASDAP